MLFSPYGLVGKCLDAKLNNEDINLYYWDRDKRNFPDGNIDTFIYIASITSSRKEKAEKYIVDNSYSAIEVVNECKKYYAKRIIYLSTDEVYGSIQTDGLNENSDKINLNAYAMSKLLAEKVILESGIPYYIIRSCGIVGSGTLGDSFLERTALQIKQGKDVRCTHTEDLFNNVVHVSDLADFIARIAAANENFDSRVFHVGQTEAVKLSDIMAYLCNRFHSKSKIIPSDGNGRYFVLPTDDAEKLGYRSRGIYKILDEIVAKIDSRITGNSVEFFSSDIYIADIYEIKKMKSKAIESLSSKYRLCLHKDINDKMHVMFSVYPAYSYVRPHYHPKKSELKIVVKGSIIVLIYDKQGKEIERRFLEKGKDEIMYIREGINHTNIPITDCILLEVTPGPFDSVNDNIFLDGFPEFAGRSEVKDIFDIK